MHEVVIAAINRVAARVALEASVPRKTGFQIFGGYAMVGAGAKGGEGMGRAAAAEVRGGWVGMVLRVQASPDHAPAARAPLLGRPAGAVAPAVERSGGFPRPFVQTASFPGNYRLKRLPTPQKVAAQELIRKLVSNCTLLCVCRGSCAPDPPAIPTGTNSYCTCCRRSLRPKRRVSSLLVLHIHILDSCVGSLNFLLIIYLDQPIRAPRHHWRAEVV